MQNLEISAQKIIKNEQARYLQLHAKSIALSESAHQHFLYGVPMHWMSDWGTPVPLFVQQAQGSHFTCADGINYTDFCLGDTGAMFGHSPPSVAKAITEQASNGFTAMLPSTLAPNVGEALSEFFWFRLLAACHHRNRCQPLCITLGTRSHKSQKSVGV